MKPLVAAVLVAASLAGCGSGLRGTATVWVTRDRGAHVLLVRKVPAGLTAMQGLERVAHVQTRYAGRFVQTIDGISGSLARQQDWFYFVNGYEADRGAVEYRLHPGDLEWWDYRSWKRAMHVPVVVGAFPEPFLHGYGGKTRPTYVVAPSGLLDRARKIAAIVHGQAVPAGAPLGANVNVILLLRGKRSVQASLRGDAPGNPVQLVLRTAESDPLAVLRAARFRYSLP